MAFFTSAQSAEFFLTLNFLKYPYRLLADIAREIKIDEKLKYVHPAGSKCNLPFITLWGPKTRVCSNGWYSFISIYSLVKIPERICGQKLRIQKMNFTENSLNSWHDFRDKRGWVSLKPHPEGRRFSHRTPTEASDKGSKV